MTIKQHKVVVALPIPLEPDSIYYVRNGGGFDIHVTNNSGVVVGYELNASLDKVDKVVGMQLSQESFTTEEKLKLLGVADEATKNRADSENADKVHTHTIAQVTGLDTALSDKASNTDPRFTDAREWTAATISQAEAEAGAASTRRAWTAQRVRQSVAAWWGTMTGTGGSQFRTNTQNDARFVQLDGEDWRASDWDKSYTIALRAEAEVRLKRNSVVYFDFANGEYLINSEYAGKEPKALPQAIDYTAPDGISVQTSDGRIVTAPADTPAIVWSEGECQGLQVAPASTNLLRWSEDLTNASWSVTRASISSDAPVSPDGATTADKLVESGDEGGHQVAQTLSVVSGSNYVVSVFAKKGERSQFALNFYDGTNHRTIFDLENGIVSRNNEGNTAFIKSVGDGWYHCAVANVANSTTLTAIVLVVEAGALAYTGDGSSGIYIWGAQLEQGYPTPYIKTEASQVTRGAITGKRDDMQLKDGNSTVFWEGVPYRGDDGKNGAYFKISSNNQPFGRGLAFYWNGTVFGVGARDDAGVLTQITSGLSVTSGQRCKVCVVGTSVGFRVFTNGSSIGTLAKRNLSPYLESVQFGGSGTGVGLTGTPSPVRGDTSRFIAASGIITDAEAIALTTLEDE